MPTTGSTTWSPTPTRSRRPGSRGSRRRTGDRRRAAGSPPPSTWPCATSPRAAGRSAPSWCADGQLLGARARTGSPATTTPPRTPRWWPSAAACAARRRLLAGRGHALRLVRAVPAVHGLGAVGAGRPGRLRRRPARRRPRRLRRPGLLRAVRPRPAPGTPGSRPSRCPARSRRSTPGWATPTGWPTERDGPAHRRRRCTARPTAPAASPRLRPRTPRAARRRHLAVLRAAAAPARAGRPHRAGLAGADHRAGRRAGRSRRPARWPSWPPHGPPLFRPCCRGARRVVQDLAHGDRRRQHLPRRCPPGR